MEIRRFLWASALIKSGQVILKAKGKTSWEFEVAGKYTVTLIIREDLEHISCTCPYGSFYGQTKKRNVPCAHAIAAYASICQIFGPVLRERWSDPVNKAVDSFFLLSPEDREKFQKVISDEIRRTTKDV